MNTSHTPTPWRIKDNRHKPDSACDTGFMLFPEKGNKAIGRIYKGSELSHSEETQEANAQFIVRAVNSHEALVAALKRLLPHDMLFDIEDYADEPDGAVAGEISFSEVREAVAALSLANS